MLASGKEFCPSETSTLEPGSSSADGKNPMMNSVVLARLFEFCDLSDLLGHRLVCKEWYFASVARIRNEMFIKITADQNGILNWSNYDKEFEVAGAPFRCFRVRGVDFMNPPSTPTERWECSPEIETLAEETNTSIEKIYKNIEQFWEEHGNSIRKLDLYDVSVFSVKAFKKVLFEQTPNLEELKMGVVNNLAEATGDDSNIEMGRIQSNLKSFTVGRSGEGPFPVKWKHIFLQFPKIQKLKLLDVCQEAINALHDICESIDEIPLKELGLKGLTLWHARSRDLRNFLELPKLKLSKLEMNVHRCNEEERNILQLALRVHGHTLKELVVESSLFAADSSLKYDPFQPNNNFPFRQDTLEQLTLLELKWSVFQTWRFLKQTPNLKGLRICAFNADVLGLRVGNRDLEVIVDEARLPFLKKFEFTGPRLSERELGVLVKVMPNVEEFRGDVDASALRIIRQHWRN